MRSVLSPARLPPVVDQAADCYERHPYQPQMHAPQRQRVDYSGDDVLKPIDGDHEYREGEKPFCSCHTGDMELARWSHQPSLSGFCV